MKLIRVAYDLRYFGTSFAFVEFLCTMEALRQIVAPDSSGLEVLIITGKYARHQNIDFENVQFGATYGSVDDYERQRLEKIVLPLASLIPSVKSISILDTRFRTVDKILLENLFFPAGIDLNNTNLFEIDGYYPYPRMLYACAALTDIRYVKNSPASLKDARAYASRLVSTKAPVVFTLRNHKFSKDRSRDNTAHYLSIAEKLSAIYPVIVIPDTADVSCGINTSLPVAYEASQCLRLRSALYEVALANFCGGVGPASLMNLNRDVTYYEADIATGDWSTTDWMERQWAEAMSILERSNFPLRENYMKRLQQLKSGRNYFSPESPNQVCDLESLTLEKATTFLHQVETSACVGINS